MDESPEEAKKQTPSKRQKASFWEDEIKSSSKMLRKWQQQGKRIVERYLDDRKGAQTADDGFAAMNANGAGFRLNLFHQNTSILQDMLYGNLPTVDVARTQQDANDDVARVAGDIIERILNLDIQNHAESYDAILHGCLQDRLLPGLGCARVRYEVEMEEQTIEAVIDAGGFVLEAERTEMVTLNEDAPIEYFHWQDVSWGWCRSWADMPWLGFRSYLTKEQVKRRFPECNCDDLTFKKQKVGPDDDSSTPEDDSPFFTAEIWEIWDKESKCVYWFSKGYEQLLDKKKDPLQLKGFYPAPPFFIANPTTTLYKPTPDYHLAQDLYNEVDRLQTRIAIITEAVKVVGCYDSSADGIQRMLQEGVENDLIPVDNWALFAEKGGIKGQVDWLPIDTIAGVLDKLVQLRDQTIALLQQVTGMSDVMRGGLENQYEGVGQTQIKSNYGSVRIQALQDQFARFAGDLMQIKTEIICKHFDPATIIKLSNAQYMFDQDKVQPAVALLKEPEMASLRIDIRSENLGMIDYAKLKNERTEYIGALANFLQTSAPLIQQEPASLPFLMQMLQWSLAGFKGSNEIEGVLDQMIEAAQKKVKAGEGQDKPDPQKQLEQMKAQTEMQKIQAKAQADMQLRQQDMQMDIQTAQAVSQSKLMEIQASSQAKMAEINAKLQADLATEEAKMQANIAQSNAGAEAEVQKTALTTQMEMEKNQQEALIKQEELAVQAEANLRDIIAQHATSIKEMEISMMASKEESKSEESEEEDD